MYLRLQSFDGPLDLLLHLIKAQEINIFNIPISKVAEQFQAFVTRVPFLDFLELLFIHFPAQQFAAYSINLLISGNQLNSVGDGMDKFGRVPDRKC